MLVKLITHVFSRENVVYVQNVFLKCGYVLHWKLAYPSCLSSIDGTQYVSKYLCDNDIYL